MELFLIQQSPAEFLQPRFAPYCCCHRQNSIVFGRSVGTPLLDEAAVQLFKLVGVLARKDRYLREPSVSEGPWQPSDFIAHDSWYPCAHLSRGRCAIFEDPAP